MRYIIICLFLQHSSASILGTSESNMSIPIISNRASRWWEQTAAMRVVSPSSFISIFCTSAAMGMALSCPGHSRPFLWEPGWLVPSCKWYKDRHVIPGLSGSSCWSLCHCFYISTMWRNQLIFCSFYSEYVTVSVLYLYFLLRTLLGVSSNMSFCVVQSPWTSIMWHKSIS